MIEQFRDEYRWLSNFTPVKVVYEGVEYASVEHAYMSAKSHDMAWKSRCADSQISAAQIKKESKEIDLRPDWEDVKFEVMLECVRQKMAQEPFKSKLEATGNVYIQEGNTWGDTFWGADLKTGEGINALGQIIMQIRDEQRTQESSDS
jgi:ribA/ribD-fused uncharacterized protein